MTINHDNDFLVGFSEISVRGLKRIIAILLAGIIAIIYRKEIWSSATNTKNLIPILLTILATALILGLMRWQGKRMAEEESQDKQDKIAVVGLFHKIAEVFAGVIFMAIAAVSWIIVEKVQYNLYWTAVLFLFLANMIVFRRWISNAIQKIIGSNKIKNNPGGQKLGTS